VRSRIFLKAMIASLVLLTLATVIIDFMVRGAWENSLRQQIQTSLTQKASLFAAQLRDVHNPDLKNLVATAAKLANARVTVIESSGKVLADSEANPDTMENHATRPEFQAALRNNVGSNSRVSHTLGIEFLYLAVPVNGGAVRLAYPLSAIHETASQIRSKLIDSSLIALLVSLIAAALVARSISRRLQRITTFAGQVASGKLSARIADESGDEITEVAEALNRTAQRLENSFAALASNRKELEALLNSMQDPVLAISSGQKIEWFNGPMGRLLPHGLQFGRSLLEAVRDPDLIAALCHSMEQGSVGSVRVGTIQPGQVFQATTAPLPNGGAVAVMHNLTEIERVEKTRRDFIANVSHELRTPLTSIQGYTETLLDTGLIGNGNAREFLEVIRKNVGRMSRLTEDLLVLARVESGDRKLEVREVPADALLREASQNYQNLAQLHGVRLTVEGSITSQVAADRDAIHQVFSNLIDNAIKYGGDGGEVALGARIAEGKAEFYVRDSGPGIAAEHLPRIFERFYRVDQARSRESGGTGLGLAIVKHIVLNHGGTVRVESSLNHGATFFFTLPLAAVGAAHRS